MNKYREPRIIHLWQIFILCFIFLIPTSVIADDFKGIRILKEVSRHSIKSFVRSIEDICFIHGYSNRLAVDKKDVIQKKELIKASEKLIVVYINDLYHSDASLKNIMLPIVKESCKQAYDLGKAGQFDLYKSMW